jgi:hypothetical protein
MIYSIHVQWHDPNEPEMIGTLLADALDPDALLQIKRRICKEMLDAGYAAVPHTYMRLHRQHCKANNYTGEPKWHLNHLST